MSSILLTDTTVLTVNSQNSQYSPGWVSVVGGRISGVGPMSSVPPANDFDRVLSLPNHLLMPGFINAHTHAAMLLFRGHAEGHSLLTLAGWYNAIRTPELSLQAEDIAPAVALSCAEMLLSGTTTFCDQYFFADQIAQAAAESRMRAVIAYGIVQLGDEQRGAEELARAEQFIAQWQQPDSRIIPWLGPHAPYVDNSESLLRAEAELAQRYDVGLHLHMAVGPDDNELTLSKYGLSASQALAHDGFFQARVHAAHCLDLSADDIGIFAQHGASVAYCATAGLRSGRENICPVRALQAAEVTVAIGTDNMAANNSYDMISEMRVAGLAASHRERCAQPLSSKTLVRMATIDGAKALGIDQEVGSIEIGKYADLVAIDMAGAGYSDSPEIESLLVYSGSGRDVSHVFVAGEMLVSDGELTKLDVAELRKNFTDRYQDFWGRVNRTSH